MKVDAHQLFWQPVRGVLHWMPKDNAALHRAWGPSDLASLPGAMGIDGTARVQATAGVSETEYRLGLADATRFNKSLVG